MKGLFRPEDCQLASSSPRSCWLAVSRVQQMRVIRARLRRFAERVLLLLLFGGCASGVDE